MKLVFSRWIFLFVSLILCISVTIGKFYKDSIITFLNRDIVAAYNGNYLLNTDIPADADIDASVINWASNIFLQERLEKMLTTDKISKINYMTNIYKANLYMYLYLNQYLESDDIKNMNLSDEELFEYYNNNSSLFSLEDDIIKYIYIVIPSKFAKNIQSLSIKSKEDMYDFCSKYSSLQKERIVKEDWCDIKELTNSIQLFKKIKINSSGLYLVKDKLYSHYLFVYDIKNKGQNAPFNMIKAKVVEQLTKDKILNLRTDLENEAKKHLKKSRQLINYTSRIKK